MMGVTPPAGEPATVVVFGGTGDLMRKKLLPALYQLSEHGQLPERTQILAATRSRDLDDEKFRAWAREALQAAGISSDSNAGRWCEECLRYQGMGKEEASDYQALALVSRQALAGDPVQLRQNPALEGGCPAPPVVRMLQSQLFLHPPSP